MVEQKPSRVVNKNKLSQYIWPDLTFAKRENNVNQQTQKGEYPTNLFGL